MIRYYELPAAEIPTATATAARCALLLAAAALDLGPIERFVAEIERRQRGARRAYFEHDGPVPVGFFRPWQRGCIWVGAGHSPGSTARTVLHELRHAWQFEVRTLQAARCVADKALSEDDAERYVREFPLEVLGCLSD
jgi:hypothetical protein